MHMYCKNVIMSMFCENTITIVLIKEVCIIKAPVSPIVFRGMHPCIGTIYIIILIPSDTVNRQRPRLHVSENDIYAPAYTHARYRYVV